MRELTENELDLVAGGHPTCGAGDDPPYGDGGSGLGDWLKAWVLISGW